MEFLKTILYNSFFFLVLNMIMSLLYIRWATNKKMTPEILLYQIRGKFTRYNVLLWLERIENELGYKQVGLRNKITKIAQSFNFRKRPFSEIKTKLTEVIEKKSFGKYKRITAFKRMHKNTKLLLFGFLLQIIGPVIVIIQLYSHSMKFVFALMLGLTGGLFVSGLLAISIYNFFYLLFASVTEKVLKKNGHAGYLHISLVQLSVFGFKFYKCPQSVLMAITDIEIENGESHISFHNFKGNGAAGNW